MLGQIYKPSGLALETAQAVLEVENPHACNVALGCSNGCTYCYLPYVMRRSREECLIVRHPKESPRLLVEKQLLKRGLPQGVFLSFLTDPFLEENRGSTERLIELLRGYDVSIATSSKVGTSMFPVKHGMSIVSLDHDFWRAYEPNALPPWERIDLLKDRGYTWISLEPYPPSAIWKQDLTDLLEAIGFVDLIIFGKWNYDARARTIEARKEYAENITVLRSYCECEDIQLHIKSDTLKFCLPEKVKQY